ncbi:MAG: type I phosphomannose isomerase catalytic subunit [Planctomycetota bacterium]
MTDPYPLILEPILKEKVWGGRRLERWGKALPPGANIGESWEMADLSSTRAGGGGGGAEHSRIANGPLAGKTLRDAIGLWGRDLLGDVELTPDGGFPLLVKYLDAREHLSVQVHPSPEYAAAHPDAHLKTECWYVLEAEPRSVIYKGLKPGVTLRDVERALTGAGQGSGVVDLLQTHEAIPGDMHSLPSGTVHALGAGVLVAEVQTPSDTTFRVYDWAKEYGRVGRELHIDAALACITTEAPPRVSILSSGGGEGLLVATEYFRVELRRRAWDVALDAGPLALMMLEGVASVGGATIRCGRTALCPRGASVVMQDDACCLVTRL